MKKRKSEERKRCSVAYDKDVLDKIMKYRLKGAYKKKFISFSKAVNELIRKAKV